MSHFYGLLWSKHVPCARSADVTTSSQQICAGSCAAALRIRRLRWTASAAISRMKNTHGGGVCPSLHATSLPLRGCRDFRQRIPRLKSASPTETCDLQTFSQIPTPAQTTAQLSPPFGSCFCSCLGHGRESAGRRQQPRSHACEN